MKFLFILAAYLSMWCQPLLSYTKGLPLFYWDENSTANFGDHLSRVLVERIVGAPLECYTKRCGEQKKKLLAIGSILYFALSGDVIWGTGVNGKILDKRAFRFTDLDIRAVRGPLTRQFILDEFHIQCPEVYGDPALLFPYFFEEFKKKENPSIDYLLIPHYTDQDLFSKEQYTNVVYVSDPWEEIIEKILDSRFVIATSLHGIVLAEAYGIPARFLRVSESPHNHLFKYYDYYLGTHRPNFQTASSIEQALHMGGEPPIQCDLEKLYNAFPFEFWPDVQFKHPKFKSLP